MRTFLGTPEDTVLSEMRQTQKNKCRVTLLSERSRITKSIEAGRRIVVDKGWWGGEGNGQHFHVRIKVLEADGSNG